MTVTVPTWTLVLPLVAAFALGVWLVIRFVETRWVQPWIDRWLAARWGVPIEEVIEARKKMRL